MRIRMNITKEQIRDFQNLYSKQFGVNLSITMARQMATSLLQVFTVTLTENAQEYKNNNEQRTTKTSVSKL